jgi:hypothetical protein
LFPGAACCHLIDLLACKAAPIQTLGKPAPGKVAFFEDEDDDENDYELGALTVLSSEE